MTSYTLSSMTGIRRVQVSETVPLGGSSLPHKLYVSDSKLVDGGVVVHSYTAMCACGWKSRPKTQMDSASEAWERHIESGNRGPRVDKELIAEKAIDRLTTDCRETVKDLYGTKFQQCIGPINWLLEQLMQTVMERQLDDN